MTRAITLCLLGVLGVLGHSWPAAAQGQSKKDLEAEIAQLKSDIEPLVLQRLETAGVKVDVAMMPVERFFLFIQSLGEDSRRVTWSMTRAHGQLLAWNSECKLGPIKIGDLAAFAEFDGANVSGGGFVHRPQDNLNGVMLRNLSATWDPSQRHLTFAIGATADFFLPTVRLFLDLDCFGGGNEIGKVGPLTLRTNAKTDGRLSLSVGASQLFAANVPMNLKGEFDLCASFGSVGTLCIKVEKAIDTSFAWEFGGAVTGAGSIDVPNGGQTITKSYSFDLSDRRASTWIRGYSLSITPKVVWR